MGYLLHIFLAISIQGVAEAQLVAPLLSPLWGFLVLPLPYLLAAGTRRAALGGRFRLAERLLRLLHLWGPLAYAFSGLTCGQIDWIRDEVGQAASIGWPSWAGLLSLLPFLLWQLQGIDAHTRSLGMQPAARTRQRNFQARLFFSAFLPILLYVSICAAIGRDEALRVHIERVGLFNMIFVLLLLLLLASLLPWILSRTWETESLPAGGLRELMSAVARQASFRARDLRIWHTGHSTMNAAIIGLHHSSRVVFFSDSLLSLLSPREIAAVFGHEIGHAVRHHVLIFLAWSLAFFVAAGWISSGWELESEWLSGGVLLGWVVLWGLAFGWLSRRYELDADLYSIELVGDGPALISALERVGGRLRDVAGWRHFSTSSRVSFLLRAMHEPSFARAFRRRWMWVGRLGVLAALVAGGFELRELVHELPEDRVVAELCLGRYREAVERARGLELDGELDGLCRLAEEYAREEPLAQAQLPRERLLTDLGQALARAEARAGSDPGPLEALADWPRLLLLSRLAALRDLPHLFSLSDAIESALPADPRSRPARRERAELLASLADWRAWVEAAPR